MNFKAWKSKLPPVLNELCREIRVNDAVIDWVDIVFEQTGNGGRCPAHSHTWYEFNYVLAGQLSTRFYDENVLIGEGEFFLIPPGMTHSHVYDRENPLEGICLRWRFRSGRDEANLNDSPQDNDSLYDKLVKLKDWRPGAYRDNYGLLPILVQLFDEAALPRPKLHLQLLLVQFLVGLTTVPESRKLSDGTAGQISDALVRKVEVYLEDFHGKRLNVEKLAASLHMSYGHLSRLYKRKTGRTIIEEMNRIRLEKACELLGQPSLFIKEVAEQSGFPDIYYFSKAFKKKYGVSPQTYRKQINL